jgi:hypothetical protein
VGVLPNFGPELPSNSYPDENWKMSKRKHLLQAELQGRALILIPEKAHIRRYQVVDFDFPFQVELGCSLDFLTAVERLLHAAY